MGAYTHRTWTDSQRKEEVKYNQLETGMRYRFKDSEVPMTFTLTRKYWEEPEYPEYLSYSSSEESQRVILTPDNGGSAKTFTGWELYKLTEGLIYHPSAGFNVGDYFEIKRDGLEPDLRGRLLEIDPESEMWPYRVGQPDGPSVWFAWHELTKIHSVISYKRAPKAKEVLKEQIARTRAELEALETALEVLEYAS